MCLCLSKGICTYIICMYMHVRAKGGGGSGGVGGRRACHLGVVAGQCISVCVHIM